MESFVDYVFLKNATKLVNDLNLVLSRPGFDSPLVHAIYGI